MNEASSVIRPRHLLYFVSPSSSRRYLFDTISQPSSVTYTHEILLNRSDLLLPPRVKSGDPAIVQHVRLHDRIIRYKVERSSNLPAAS